MRHLLSTRRAGLLLHVTSLPPGVDLEAGILDLVRFMGAGGLSIWQLLPLNPRDRFLSPYRTCSVFALDPALAGAGSDAPLAAAERSAFEAFQDTQHFWLVDYTRYMTLLAAHGPRWIRWPEALKNRDADALAAWDHDHPVAMSSLAVTQFRLRRAWSRIRTLAREHGVLLFGDLPIYPAYDSADVWAHREMFQLNEAGRPCWVAGVPPDYFAAEGQLWGNPVYDWEHLRADGYRWWNERVARQLELFDVLRFDHFRGFEAYWRVSPTERTARQGHWQTGPGAELLAPWNTRYLPCPFVAEDLGLITEGVHELRDQLGWPGMRVLQFGFDGSPDNPHLPANCEDHVVAYTGTHDNDTTLGWYRSLDDGTRAQVDRTLAGRHRADVPWACIDSVVRSAANTAMVPMQDFLSLDGSARMNTPGRARGNWRWRLPQAADVSLALRVRRLLEDAGRVPAGL